MNNDTQTTTGADNSQLGPTRNPQNPGGQELNQNGNNLQTPTNLVTNSQDLTITSVGNSNSSQPASIQNTSQIPVGAQAQSAKKPPYGIFALSTLAIGIVILITWLMTRSKTE